MLTIQAVTPVWLPDSRMVLMPVAAGLNALGVHAQATGSKRQLHVLMIEDDVAIAEMYRVQLEHDGYRVTLATTGDIGFSAMASAAPDIVLLDLLLPDKSGFDVMAGIVERFPNHPPVVILSNYGEPTMMDKGRSLGAVEYLVKSRVTPGMISEAIPGWIEQAGRGHATN